MNPIPRAPRKGLAAAGMVLLLTSCSGPAPQIAPEPEPLYDLVGELPLAVATPGFAAGDEGAEGMIEASDDVLSLPPGAQLDFHFDLPAGAVLAIDELAARGLREGKLQIAHKRDRRKEKLLATLAPSTEPMALPLVPALAGPIRLSLRALGLPAVGADRPAMLLRHPRILPAPSQDIEAIEIEPPSLEPEGAAEARQRPNIIVYMVDTLRADHLGCYGYDRPISPAIDRFAAEAALFENAQAQSSWTKASIASIFTGVWPPGHSALRREDRLPEAAFTLAEILRRDGYRTAAVSANPSISETFGFHQGFDDFALLGEDALADAVNAEAFSWLDTQDSEEPFFLYLHTLDPHDPYLPPEAFRRRFAPSVPREVALQSSERVEELVWAPRTASPELTEDLLALYDAEIAFNDSIFGELLADLEKRGILDDALLIFLSDHGEAFGEHRGWRHGTQLHRESVHVPLVIKLPGMKAGKRIPERVQHTDLLPTILDLLGLEIPTNLEGWSLLPLLQAEAGEVWHRRSIFQQVNFSGPQKLAMVQGGWKLILNQGRAGANPIYDLEADPLERRSRVKRFAVRAATMKASLRRKLEFETRALAPEKAVIDRATEESLRALGYVD